MTTIAYKDGVMAWDSRISADSAIVTDDAQKMFTHEGRTFWMAGVVGDWELFVKCYAIGTVPRVLNVAALVLDKGRLYSASTDDSNGRIWTSPVLGAFSIGSGSPHALTAMDCGLDPAQAVRMAVKRDAASGGKIRKLKLRMA